ncbi:MAG: helix-turn-helix domain-containing protein [Lachnospiraceae bacterium]|nr:helix-turn-helix domain-containing protein [Lachnospiraceae bacterium]
MYPLYWTPSKEGIFMRYSFEFKVECVDKYRQGFWPVTPEGIKESNFHQTIRKWARIEDSLGIDALKHNNFNKEWSAEEKLKFVSRVLAGESLKKVAYSAGIEHSLLSRWVTKYKTNGYNGLVGIKKGRPCKGNPMKKKNSPLPLTESEREELIRLRAENEYIKAENEVIKKRIALRQEKEAAQLKAKKQQLSKNSVKKDIN